MYSTFEQFVRQRDDERHAAAAQRRMLQRRSEPQRHLRTMRWTVRRSAQFEIAATDSRLTSPLVP